MRALLAVTAVFAVAVSVVGRVSHVDAVGAGPGDEPLVAVAAEVVEEVAADPGPTRVIVDVAGGAGLTAADVAATGAQPVAMLDEVDQIVVDVDAPQDLDRLRALVGVESIALDHVILPSLAEATAIVGQPSAASGGATGLGGVIAVLDTGISTGYFGSCGTLGAPGCAVQAAYEVNVAPFTLSGYNGAAPNDGQLDDDPAMHGTRVSLAALGTAPQAQVVFVDVYAKFTCAAGPCTYGPSVLLSSDAMIAAGLNKVLQLKAGGLNIDVMNLSAGSSTSYTTATCPTTLTSTFNQLRSAGVLPVVAAGNDGAVTGLSSPGCQAAALAVGATYVSTTNSTVTCGGWSMPRVVDGVTCFSNSSADLDLWAPGSVLLLAGGYVQGTSFSAPLVAGAVAALAAQTPSAGVDQIAAALTATGPVVTDSRNGVARHRLDMSAAQAGLMNLLAPSTSGTGLVAVSPTRALDTRPAPYGPIGSAAAPIGPGGQSFPVADALGVAASSMSAAVLNITGIMPPVPCYVTVWPSGTAAPYSSNLNLAPGQTLANSVIVGVGLDGRVAISSSCSMDVAVDITGWFPAGTDVQTVAPQRIVDTRPGSTVGVGAAGAVAAPLTVSPLGQAGLPADPALVDSVLVNVTVDGPSEAAYLTIWPSGSPQPYTSSLNFGAGETATNFHIAKLGADGRFVLAPSNGATQVIVDVFGWVPKGSGTYAGLEPTRILDTRYGEGTCATGCATPGPAAVVRLAVAAVGGVPADARAVALKVTAASATSPTYLTLYPSGTATPNASNLFVTPGAVTPNLVTAKLGVGGFVDIFNAAGATAVVVDVVGYYR